MYICKDITWRRVWVFQLFVIKLIIVLSFLFTPNQISKNILIPPVVKREILITYYDSSLYDTCKKIHSNTINLLHTSIQHFESMLYVWCDTQPDEYIVDAPTFSHQFRLSLWMLKSWNCIFVTAVCVHHFITLI